MPAETFDAQRDPRMRYNVDWFINTTEGRHKNPRESTEMLWNRCLLPLEPRPKRILELGQCEGRSTFWLIQNLKPELIVGVDPWRPDRRFHADIYSAWKENYFHNVAQVADGPFVGQQRAYLYLTTANNGETAFWQAVRPSEDYLRADVDTDFPGQPFDLAYVDGDHSSLCAMTDMIMCWRKLKPGGVMIIDDFDRRWHNARPACREAVLAFWTLIEHSAHRLQITDAVKGLENQRQFWLRKWRD